ncbi:MAG: energy-coupling factor ABC transporter ATP-binding protein [Candidatus Cloacimonetes bacterium]|nr:energy-coupling factor ABC transporter ATP-binding protein [Candidatus Cloacimonadota bacterium]MCB5287288.1 energy-coupling factor ABC transporter ATP-binding protein [Candidatus Cloacimonadota bacterium]MCK9184574.1 energy-coupling factor ABC transporter ATP-binding protein [Candidatus Cloacimonadota bacterium]MCK9585084.1 energy-coupling factor ABC transporter ATP-binding protein [Candidatus Cloacimonadota bacterium]MDY0229610.1 ABC transporter ATP-binding protein [Candidatus Cloacimonada
MKEQKISSSCLKLQVQALSLSFPDAENSIWEELCFTASEGDILAITGANASGKTCLIQALCGIIPQSIPAELSGTIALDSINLRELPLCEIYRYMSVALSDAKSQMMFPTCELEIAFALENMALPADEIRQRIDAAASYFGFTSLLQQDSQKLSGGEQRLLLFAICQALRSPILLFDEPEAGLSQSSMTLLIRWLAELKAEGRIVIIATHNDELIGLADQQIKL